MSKLIIWSKNSDVFLEEIEKKDRVIVESYTDLEECLQSRNQNFEAILLEVELQWGNHEVDEFYGFDIALELRTKFKQKCPIVLCSCLSVDVFEHLSDKEVKYNILFGRGSGFLELQHFEKQVIQETINEIEALSDAGLADVSEMLCNLKGLVVDKLTHDLKFESSESKLSEVLNSVSIYLNTDQLIRTDYSAFSKLLLSKKTDGNNDSFIKVKDEFVNLCKTELTEDKPKFKVKSKKAKLTILVLEDDAEWLNKLVTNLTLNFEVIPKSNALEAIEILDNDTQNNILAIISDWRLYHHGTKYWQKQGYEVLEYAAKTRYIALFGFTSEIDFNVHNVRNSLGLDIILKKKHEFINESNWNSLRQSIQEECEKVGRLIASLPTGALWRSTQRKKEVGRSIFISLQEKYRSIRNRNWKTNEYKVSQYADVMWTYYKQSLGKNIETENRIDSIHNKFGVKFGDEPKLPIILVLRRIYLALWYSEGKIKLSLERKKKLAGDRKGNYQEIYKVDAYVKVFLIFKGVSWEEYPSLLSKAVSQSVTQSTEENYKKLQALARTFARELCIEPSELPLGILPEEESWLFRNGFNLSSGIITTKEIEQINEELKPNEDEIENEYNSSDNEIIDFDEELENKIRTIKDAFSSKTKKKKKEILDEDFGYEPFENFFEL